MNVLRAGACICVARHSVPVRLPTHPLTLPAAPCLCPPPHPAVQLSQPLVPLVDEFAARLFGELDYVQEGRNAERFEELYRHVPRVGWWCGLVMCGGPRE